LSLVNNSPSKNYLIIVPIFNGVKYIRCFYDRVPEDYCPALLFIDDGSTDRTSTILESIGCRFVTHGVNRGKGAALLTGMDIARIRGIENIVVLDVDLQHPPELIEKFLEFKTGEMQIAYRRDRKTMPLHRKLSNFLTSLFITVRTNTVIKDSQCGFRAFPVRLGLSQKIGAAGFQYESELLLKAALSGYRIVHREIPVIYDDEPSQMNNVTDTLKFMILWFRSFFW